MWTVTEALQTPGGLPGGGDTHPGHKSWSGAGVVTRAQAQARCEVGVGSAGEGPWEELGRVGRQAGTVPVGHACWLLGGSQRCK